MQHIDPSTIHPALPDLIGKLAQVGVDKVILYGSRARGDDADRADIDLCIDTPNIDAVKWDKILQTVERTQTLLTIDTVYLPKATEALKANILREGKLLYVRQ